LSVFATAATDYGVFGLSQFGPVLATYQNCETIGDEILPYFQELDHTDLIHSVAILDTAREQVYWSITNSQDSPDNQSGLVYSYAQQAWGKRQNSMWNAAGIIGNSDDFNQLIIGDTLGQIKSINAGVYEDDVLFTDINGQDLTQSIDLSFETPWLTLSNSNNTKQLRALRINCAQLPQTLQVSIYINQDESAPVATRLLDMNLPVNMRKIIFGAPFRTIKLVVSTVGSSGMTQINSLAFYYSNWGTNSNV
jgi:hypothetical protein